MKPITIIFDNAGGIIVQSDNWAGYWHDGPEAADSIAALLDGADPTSWESDEEAAILDPTNDQIRSGGYSVVILNKWGDIDLLDPSSSWFNEAELAKRLETIYNEQRT